MDLTTIIGIIIILIAIVFVLRVFKSIFKAIFLISTLFGIVIMVFLIILYQDVSDFKTNFPTAEKLFLLEENNTLIAGFSGVLMEQAQPDFVSSGELNSYKLSYEVDDLETILGNNYKLFIVELDSFEDIKNIEFAEEELSKNFVLNLLESNYPIDNYANYYAQSQGVPAAIGDFKEQIKAQFPSNTEFKGALFASMFSAATQKDSLFLFREYKKENIVIYPETLLFRTSKKIPLFLFKRLIKTENGNTG